MRGARDHQETLETNAQTTELTTECNPNFCVSYYATQTYPKGQDSVSIFGPQINAFSDNDVLLSSELQKDTGTIYLAPDAYNTTLNEMTYGSQTCISASYQNDTYLTTYGGLNCTNAAWEEFTFQPYKDINDAKVNFFVFDGSENKTFHIDLSQETFNSQKNNNPSLLKFNLTAEQSGFLATVACLGIIAGYIGYRCCCKSKPAANLEQPIEAEYSIQRSQGTMTDESNNFDAMPEEKQDLEMQELTSNHGADSLEEESVGIGSVELRDQESIKDHESTFYGSIYSTLSSFMSNISRKEGDAPDYTQAII